VSHLKSLLMPQLRLTRAGNISSRQPTPPPPQPYDFYLAQLIHYGLDFHFEIEAAQRALEIEIRLAKLTVPPGLLNLEKELKKAHERERSRAHSDVLRYAAKQALGETVDAAISVDASEDESEDKSIQRSAPRKSAKQQKPRAAVQSPVESDVQSTSEGSSIGFEGNSDEESDTIAVAPDIHESTSSDVESSSESDEVPEVKRSGSVSSGHNGNDNGSSEEADNEENSSDNDPFFERQDFKRIKLEKADEQHDSILRSTREAAPFVARKQVPPSQAKLGRIASQPQINLQPIDSARNETLGHQDASINPFSSGKHPLRKPFVSPDKRPSWTIPVRSPSFAHQDSPKSVSFSQVQRETPTKVPIAEKAMFSTALKTPPQGSPHHRRTPSLSSDHSHTTPLRSILKKTPTFLPSKPHTIGTDGTKPEISINLPHGTAANATSSQRTRRQKRKLKSGANSGLDVVLDGAQDVQESTPEEPQSKKPYIVSDVVDGKPISWQGIGNTVRHSEAFSLVDIPSARSTGRWLAVNSQPYQERQQQQQQAKNQDTPAIQAGKFAPAREEVLVRSDGSQRHERTTPARVLARPSKVHTDYSTLAKRSLEGGGSLGKVVAGSGQRIGSGSRGGLVRAGRVY